MLKLTNGTCSSKPSSSEFFFFFFWLRLKKKSSEIQVLCCLTEKTEWKKPQDPAFATLDQHISTQNTDWVQGKELKNGFYSRANRHWEWEANKSPREKIMYELNLEGEVGSFPRKAREPFSSVSFDSGHLDWKYTLKKSILSQCSLKDKTTMLVYSKKNEENVHWFSPNLLNYQWLKILFDSDLGSVH